jgi:hypothetical protein
VATETPALAATAWMLIVRCYVIDYISPRQYDPAMTGQESREKPSRGVCSLSLRKRVGVRAGAL